MRVYYQIARRGHSGHTGGHLIGSFANPRGRRGGIPLLDSSRRHGGNGLFRISDRAKDRLRLACSLDQS